LLGIDLQRQAAKGVLGFAIERTDVASQKRQWLEAFKTFEETTPQGLAPGAPVSTRDHPIQAFLWGDFTAEPGTQYSYRIVALTGAPAALTEGPAVVVNTTTENPADGAHAVFFNRGVAGSQAYARKFQNRRPDDVPNNAAFDWLSRGLFEALIAFIGEAKGAGYGLRAAVYEFDYAPVLNALKRASDAGADVKIVFDAKRNSASDPRDRNLAAIQAAGIESLCTPLDANPSFIAHNKFFVLLKGDEPIAVWTGSTNITQGAIYGHSNVGHEVRDPDVAAKYLAYWTELSGNPDASELRPWTEENSPVPSTLPPTGTSAIFSPRGSLEALEWYAARMAAAGQAVFVTCPFGVNKAFQDVLEKPSEDLRYVILNKEDGSVEVMRRDADNHVAFGNTIGGGALDRWLREKLTGYNPHVPYIHTKYLLVDPLGEDPLVITGSANFSDASTNKSDENMLVIRGDKRVADIYLGEFMRLFQHFYFRDFVGDASDDGARGGHLAPDDTWSAPYFVDGSSKAKERILFSGTD
jgi:hypothetical protein